VKDCWDKKQDVRPSFKDLITRIRKLRVDLNLPTTLCPDAGKLWEKGGWMNQIAAPLTDFTSTLYDARKPPADLVSYTKCLSQICHHDQKDLADKEMSLDYFAKILKWFGPVKQGGDGINVLEIIWETVRKPWFFGVMSREESEQRLDAYKTHPGHFLVRLNAGGNSPIEACPYTISRVTSDPSEPIVHTRIQPAKKGGFFVKVGTKTYRGASLRELMDEIEVQGAQECSIVCPGHPFSNIFTVQKAFQYQEVEEDDDEGDEEEEEKPKPKTKSSSSKKSSNPSSSKKKSSSSKSKKEAK